MHAVLQNATDWQAEHARRLPPGAWEEGMPQPSQSCGGGTPTAPP